MDSLLNISPGLMIWTIINFLIFLFIVIKFGGKMILDGMKSREDRIQNAIDAATQANENAQKLMLESQEKLNNAQKEVSALIAKGREQGEAMIRKAVEEADKAKKAKVADAVREIDRSKEQAIRELRTEVAGLVVDATEKILGETLDKEKHYKLVENYLEKIPKN